ncbi:hypothetical protein G7046_g682 [Stylonectria norvegica]|nr:hypothetical protein G7046_g682 [Stylonectria norvegica]
MHAPGKAEDSANYHGHRPVPAAVARPRRQELQGDHVGLSTCMTCTAAIDPSRPSPSLESIESPPRDQTLLDASSSRSQRALVPWTGQRPSCLRPRRADAQSRRSSFSLTTRRRQSGWGCWLALAYPFVSLSDATHIHANTQVRFSVLLTGRMNARFNGLGPVFDTTQAAFLCSRPRLDEPSMPTAIVAWHGIGKCLSDRLMNTAWDALVAMDAGPVFEGQSNERPPRLGHTTPPQQHEHPDREAATKLFASQLAAEPSD